VHGVAARIDGAWEHIVGQLRHQAATGIHAAIIAETDNQEARVPFQTILDEIAHLDQEAVADYDALMLHPEAKVLVKAIAQLVRINPIVGTIAGLVGPVTSMIALFGQPQAPATAAPVQS
jgi:hypothetical protein